MTRSPSRARFTRATLAALLVVAGCGRRAQPDARGREGTSLNVILIGLDTTRADYLSCYGATNAPTPNLDRLAREGVRFDRCIAVAPSTLASFTSIMSGLYPHTHRVARNGMQVPESLEMLAERFRSRGYRTAAFLGAYALHSDRNMNQGFEVYDEDFGPGPGDLVVQRRGDKVNESVFRWLEANRDSRFFLFVHYFDPHAPYDPPPPYNEDPGFAGGPLGCDFPYLGRLRQSLWADPGGRSAAMSRHARRMYAGEIRWMDEQIGRFMQKLREMDLDARSLVVVVGDHGESMDERREELFDHGKTVFDTAVRVPLILRAPSLLPEGRVVRGQTQTIDLAPTLSELTGMPVLRQYEGRSLKSMLWAASDEGAETEFRPAFSEATKPWDSVSEGDPHWRNQRKQKCVRTERWKLVLDPMAVRPWRLFDLTKDRAESVDVYGETGRTDPRTVAELTKALTAWTNEVGATVETGRAEPDAETVRKLRSLGYAR